MTAHTKEGSRGIKFDHDSYASLLIHIITQSCYKTAEIWNTADIVVCCVSWSDCRAHCLARPLSLLFSVACFLLRGVGGGVRGLLENVLCRKALPRGPTPYPFTMYIPCASNQTKLNKISINLNCSIDLIHWFWRFNKIEHGILCEFDYRTNWM